MTTVRQLLDRKGHQVWCIEPSDTVRDAVKLMASRNVGSLLVVENGKPVGIITEKHYLRNAALRDHSPPDMPVREVMRTGFIYARPEQSVEECMAIMTDQRVRHLPVLNDGELIGIISIGDLVKHIIGEQKYTIHELINYIRGEDELRRPAGPPPISL